MNGMAVFSPLGRVLLGCGMATALAAQAAAAPLAETYLDCAPKTRDVCRAGKPCVRGAPEKLTFKVNPVKATYSRCERREADGALICDGYPVKIFNQWSGITITPKQGSFLVQVTKDLQFTEVIGYGDRVEITRGTCQVAPPPLEVISN